MERVFKNTASDSPEFANATLLTLLPVSPPGNLQSLKPAIARMICCGSSDAAKHSVDCQHRAWECDPWHVQCVRWSITGFILPGVLPLRLPRVADYHPTLRSESLTTCPTLL